MGSTIHHFSAVIIGVAFAFASVPVGAQTAQIENLAKLTPGQTKADNALWLENPLSKQFKSSRRIVIAQIKGPAEITMMHFAYARTQLGQDAAKPLSAQIGNGKPLNRDLVLRICWDGETNASVECPLVDFFCDPADARATIHNALVSVCRGFNEYFPMPFRKSAKVELDYEGPVPPGDELWRMMPCYSYVCYRTLKQFPKDTGYFHASWRQQELVLGRKEYVALQARGKGKFIGWNVSIHSLYQKDCPVDANEKFYIDGETNASVEFQGLEDSFGFSWGFPTNAVFFPLTGYFPFLNGAAAYRFFLPDSISFNKSLKVAIGFGAKENYWRRHFSKPDTAVQLSSTVYWYQTKPHAPLPPLPPLDERTPVPMTHFHPANGVTQTPVTLTISKSPGYDIPADFAGLSFETWAEKPDHNEVPGHLFSPVNKQLITLFTNSGIRNLRLGGGTVDGLHAATPSRADIDSLFGFAKAANIKVIYSLRLLDGNAADDTATAKYIWTHYRPWLDCFAIGNEPNEPPYRRTPVGAIKNYAAYLTAWRRFAVAITNAVPGAKFAGPDAGGWDWVARFAQDEKSSGLVSLVTFHEYAGGRPFINQGRDEMPVAIAINDMLSRQWLTDKYTPFYAKTLACVKPEGLPCRMTEANDYLRGVTNASNAFVSALWALDYLHWWAAHGLSGVNFHNNQWLKTDTVYLDASGNYRINPKAYAIRAFDLGSQGRVEPVAIANPNRMNLTAYAVGDGRNLCVTIINKEHDSGARAAAVRIVPDGFRIGQAAAMFLTAPGHDAGAMSGITLGGAPITNDKPWRGKWTPLKAGKAGHCVVDVPSTSAAIVKISMQ